MTHLPTSFSAQNAHRVVLFQPDLKGAEFERLEDKTADALASARLALANFEALPHEVLRPHKQAESILRKAVDDRRVLTEGFRHAAQDLLAGLASSDCPDAHTKAWDTALRSLRDALNLSLRVRDLLAAEQEIGRLRGIGR